MSPKLDLYYVLEVHFLLFITRERAISDANFKLINEKIHSFYWVDIHLRFCHIHLNFFLHRK